MHLDRTYLLLSVFALLMVVSGAARAAAGMFQFAAGDVRLVNPAGVERAARKGEALNEGDTILTGKDGVAQIKMADGGFISVRANTRMKVDTYTYTGKQDGSEKSFFSLLAGGFRALTGLIGKLNKDNYKITTPTATIGIRGTDHEPMVILPGQPALGEPGTYDKVNSGASFIATVKGVINVNPNQVGFAPGANVAPVILPKIPAFYKESPPVPVEETRRLGKEHGAAREEGKGKEEEGGVPEAGKRTAEMRKGTQPGDAAAGQPPEPDKAAPGSALLPARKPASLASPDDLPEDAGTAGAKVVAPRMPALYGKALSAPLPGKADAPAVPAGATPLLAPLPTISTTTKLAPLTTTTQSLTAPTTTTTKTLDPLVAPATTSGSTTTTTTTTTRTLDPALTTTTTTIKTLDPALTTTIQPILTAPTTTSPTLTSPTLTSPLLSPTTTTIKPLP
ncbi:MAG: FecR domain-containing protein [Pseudomonadota bacterium]